jgi:2-oxoisovalerate dehydrogenase E2 component (dihydrolipoyl transacylase)
LQNTILVNNSKALSTPAVRHLAKSHGIDINQIQGTGKNGRVTKEDIINYMDGKGNVTQSKTSSVSFEMPPLTGTTQEDQVKKIVGIKKAMTKTMTQSLTIPTFTYSDDMDATKLIKLREELK